VAGVRQAEQGDPVPGRRAGIVNRAVAEDPKGEGAEAGDRARCAVQSEARSLD
jgi:hypothetical protein